MTQDLSMDMPRERAERQEDPVISNNTPPCAQNRHWQIQVWKYSYRMKHGESLDGWSHSRCISGETENSELRFPLFEMFSHYGSNQGKIHLPDSEEYVTYFSVALRRAVSLNSDVKEKTRHKHCSKTVSRVKGAAPVRNSKREKKPSDKTMKNQPKIR